MQLSSFLAKLHLLANGNAPWASVFAFSTLQLRRFAHFLPLGMSHPDLEEGSNQTLQLHIAREYRASHMDFG